MSFPRPELYSPEQLAECWVVDVSLVERYSLTGKLNKETLFRDEYTNTDYWEPRNMDEATAQAFNSKELYLVGIYYKLEEVERFEEEYGITPLPDIKNVTGISNPRLERSDLNILGRILEVVIDDKYFPSETKFIDALLEQLEGVKGLSRRTLEERFSTAKKQYNSNFAIE